MNISTPEGLLSKDLISTIVLLLVCLIEPQAQIKAVTANGDPVILMKNGTWKYENVVDKKDADRQKLLLNKTEFKRKSTSSLQVASTRIKVGVYIDPKKWTFKNNAKDSPGELDFQLKDGEVYGGMITEKTEMPIERLSQIAFDNALTIAPDARIVKQEYRIVNGVKLIMMQMEGTIETIKFTYSGYYYSSEGGTVQLRTYTSSNLIEEYKADIEDFLNGFVILN